MSGLLRSALKQWIAGKELAALARYRKACALAWRWNGEIRGSAETAEWIGQVGEDKRGADIEQFRDRLRAHAPSAEPSEALIGVIADEMRRIGLGYHETNATSIAWMVCKHFRELPP